MGGGGGGGGGGNKKTKEGQNQENNYLSINLCIINGLASPCLTFRNCFSVLYVTHVYSY